MTWISNYTIIFMQEVITKYIPTSTTIEISTWISKSIALFCVDVIT